MLWALLAYLLPGDCLVPSLGGSDEPNFSLWFSALSCALQIEANLGLNNNEHKRKSHFEIIRTHSMKPVITSSTFLAASTLLVLAAPSVVTAQNVSGTSFSQTTNVEKTTAKLVENYWTPERLRSAKSKELAPLLVRWDGLPLTASENSAAPKPTAVSVKASGAPPKLMVSTELQKLLIPRSAQVDKVPVAEQGANILPDATSLFGAHFTTTRVFPDAATTTYPYSTTGKLFFHEVDTSGNDLGNWQCSASVLRPRIIVTAGHCVTHPSSDPKKRTFFQFPVRARLQ